MVLILAPLILAFLRRLLPPGIAWMAAAWWVVLPINFDAIYEVHLFVAIPLTFGLVAIAWWPGPWGRGTAVAALLATSLLMRNEVRCSNPPSRRDLHGMGVLLRTEKRCGLDESWSRIRHSYGRVPLADLVLLRSPQSFFHQPHDEAEARIEYLRIFRAWLQSICSGPE